MRPPIAGLDRLGPDDGVFLLHSMADMFAVTEALDRGPRSALVIGAGYIGVEMVEALTARGLQMVGRLGSEVAKRVDVAAAAIHSGLSVDEVSDLDLTYTPPLGSPWDALQVGAQAWARAVPTAARSDPRSDQGAR